MELERVGKVAFLRMTAGKANALNESLLVSLNRMLENVNQSDARALVITGEGPFFSAGFNLVQLSKLDWPAMERFIRLFEKTMLRLYTMPMPVLAAVNGHAIAGGCIMALQCDYRVMADSNGKIGLNEVQLGLGLPKVVVEVLRVTVPVGSVFPIALEGRLFSPHEAQEVGLIHAVVSPNVLESRALAKAQELAELPTAGYVHVKSTLQRPILNTIETDAEAAIDGWLDTWFSHDAQLKIKNAVERLSR